jgi:hypothetical protein
MSCRRRERRGFQGNRSSGGAVAREGNEMIQVKGQDKETFWPFELPVRPVSKGKVVRTQSSVRSLRFLLPLRLDTPHGASEMGRRASLSVSRDGRPWRVRPPCPSRAARCRNRYPWHEGSADETGTPQEDGAGSGHLLSE